MREKTYTIEQFRYMRQKSEFKQEMRRMRNQAIQKVVDRKKLQKKDVLCCLTPMSFGMVALRDLTLSDGAVIGLRNLWNLRDSQEVITAFNYFPTVASNGTLPDVSSAVDVIIGAGGAINTAGVEVVSTVVKNDPFIIQLLKEVWEWAKGLPTAFFDGIQDGIGLWMDGKMFALKSFLLEYGMQMFTIAYVCYCAYTAFKMMFNIGDAREKNHLFVWTVILIILKLLWKFVLIPA